MSVWYPVESDDVDLSDDGKTVEVLFKSDHNGNNYVEIPVKVLVKLLATQLKTEGETK